MSEPSKLWRTTDHKCELVMYAHSNGVHTQKFPGVRVMFWPDLSPCWPVNMYLVKHLRHGKTTGTVNTYASELACFIRFLFSNKIKFEEVDDNVMHQFSHYLASEPDRRAIQSLRRGGRQVNKIIRRALVYLEWYQCLFLPDERILVGTFGTGAQVTIEAKILRKNSRTMRYYWHSSMVPNDVPKDVKPLSRSVYLALLSACDQIAKSSYVQARTRTLLKLLSDTGARRVEIARLKVRDILEASDFGQGKLQVFTAKRGDHKKRFVPLPDATVDAVMSFIEIKRKLHVSRLLKRQVITHDNGFLFLSDRGQSLNVETITQDIARLRRIAGVSERATAHMLRHRWITIQVLERLKAYIGKKLPLDMGTTILTKVASMTGHKQIESLWTYIDLAFEELGIWDTAESVIHMRMNAEAAHRELSEIRHEYRNGKSLTQTDLKRVDMLLQKLLEHVKADYTKSSKDLDFQMMVNAHSLR